MPDAGDVVSTAPARGYCRSNSSSRLQKVLVGRDPLDAGRLAVFGYMGVPLGSTTQPLGVDAKVAGKNAAHPDGRGLAVAKATRSDLMSPLERQRVRISQRARRGVVCCAVILLASSTEVCHWIACQV